MVFVEWVWSYWSGCGVWACVDNGDIFQCMLVVD